MIVPLTLLASFGLVINVADEVPRYDVRPTCRAAINMVTGGGEGRTVESCLAGEEKARKELEKDWPKIPSAERIRRHPSTISAVAIRSISRTRPV